MRIDGLVRTARLVREQLQAGIRPDEMRRFRKRVSSIVRDMEAICARNGATPRRLPAPSRQAYWYLKGLDSGWLPLLSSNTRRQAAPRVAIRNVVKNGDYQAERLWEQSRSLAASASARRRIRDDLQRQATTIERMCAQLNATPASLEAPSRRVYCWLKFLLSEDNLLDHVEALARALGMVEEHRRSLDHPLRIVMVNMESLWRSRLYRDLVLLRVNEGFLNADHAVWQVLVCNAISGTDRAGDRAVREFEESEGFAEVQFELESFAGPATTSPQGHIHNLEHSFARVNAAYFKGCMPRPNLVWNHTPTLRIFGHYRHSRDTVTLSVSLDQRGVPVSLVDYLMYHELLHKKHGVSVVNGRRLVHSPAFRDDERGFAGYEAAKRRLAQLAVRQRTGRQRTSGRNAAAMRRPGPDDVAPATERAEKFDA